MNNQSKAKTPAQQDYADKGTKRAELQKVANRAALQAAREWLAANPDYSDLAIKPMNAAFVRRKDSATKAIEQLARLMMYPSNKDKTQADILRDVQGNFPNTKLHASLWQKPISSRFLKEIEPIINGNLQNKISLKGCKTLSQIRKKVKESQQIAEGARSFKVKITFTGESVIIGKESYTLEKRGSGYFIRVPDIRDKRPLVNINGLSAALMRA